MFTSIVMILCDPILVGLSVEFVIILGCTHLASSASLHYFEIECAQYQYQKQFWQSFYLQSGSVKNIISRSNIIKGIIQLYPIVINV